MAAMRPKPSCTVARASQPARTCSPWSMPACPVPVSTSDRGLSGQRTRHVLQKKAPPTGKRREPILRPRTAEASMTRTVWTTLLVLATAAAVGLPAQRGRDRDFGLSQEEWCRDARRSDVCEVREETLNNVKVIDLDA